MFGTLNRLNVDKDNMAESRYRILLIEDDKIAQMAFKRFVAEESVPYDCTIASSVSEAKGILAAGKFDAVIVDYLLGDGTAFDVFRSIVDTPIIFATSAGNEELAVRAMKTGAYDYLIKDPARNYLKLLPNIIGKAINYKKVQDKLKEYHEHLERLVAERTDQLAAEKELMSVTLASLTDGVIVVDTEKRIVLLNPVAENLTEVRYNYIKGHLVSNVFRLVDERSGGPLESPIDCVLNSQGTGPAAKCGNLIGKNGSECPVAAAAAPIRTGSGPIMGVVMVLHDLRQEREIDRMKTDFISSVSHELRTPLTSIRAYTATILRDRNMTDKTKYNFLAVILEETERLTNLVNQLLEVSHLESGTVRIVRESVDIPAIIEQVVTALEPLAQDKNIQLETDVCDQLPILLGDKGKIQSIILNLVSNAIKFTPDDGRVRISIQHRDQELVIRVSDTGVGIPREELPRIFERFYRGKRTSEQVKGTGLGLAIVKELVTMHGGRVGVESEPDRGTTFTVALPVVGEPQLEPVAG